VNFPKAKRMIVFFSIVVLILTSPFLAIPTVGLEFSAIADNSSLPLSVYIISLAGVGNYRASNHSMVVEGALQAARVDTFGVFLDWNYVVDVNVSITAHVVSDWEAYRMLIEWGNNVIVVNTHDEYLPVPSGYTKEEWVDKIADFMLKRWGTWTHLGGYPLYRVWHQNGTREEWGEQGFKKLMSHIGRGNATCYPPAEKLATFEGEYLISWLIPYRNHTMPIGSLGLSNAGYPFSFDDFKGQILYALYILESSYVTGGTIYFRPNQTAFNYGAYVHSSSWRFFDGSGYEFAELNDLAMGFISTVAAIWADVGDATYNVYGTFSDTPRARINVARLEGRTVGLDQTEDLLQKAIDAYNAHNYKMAVSYAKQAQTAAENAVQPNPTPQIIAGITLATITIGLGAYYKIHNKNKKKETQCAR